MQYPDDYEVLKLFEKQLGLPVVDLTWFEPSPVIFSIISADLVRQTVLVPIEKNCDCLRVATADPYDLQAFDNLRIQTGLKIEPVLAAQTQMDHIIRKYWSHGLDLA